MLRIIARCDLNNNRLKRSQGNGYSKLNYHAICTEYQPTDLAVHPSNALSFNSLKHICQEWRGWQTCTSSVQLRSCFTLYHRIYKSRTRFKRRLLTSYRREAESTGSSVFMQYVSASRPTNTENRSFTVSLMQVFHSNLLKFTIVNIINLFIIDIHFRHEISILRQQVSTLHVSNGRQNDKWQAFPINIKRNLNSQVHVPKM